ncbi:hypothetical protein NDU88_001424 [Pleurodeles waltl]|uniref:Uncharacterized protein n=1 Tax=Pleurodeles waltl TaxID=8319 RepID=A0AAV7S9V8_PLEWA|nr:hypothetical protein NDU88_001424 [Pleurodeles waltl]
MCSRVVPSPATHSRDDWRKGCPGGTADVNLEEEAVRNPEVRVAIHIKDGQLTRPVLGEESEEPDEDARMRETPSRDGDRKQREPGTSDDKGHRSPGRPTDRHVPGGAWLRQNKLIIGINEEKLLL